jgi:hypothetical protein
VFNHNLISLPELERVDSDSGRFYVTPTGESYPSVTSVIGAMSDKSGLDVWRARVGNAEADRISGRARARGTALHRLCELHVLNEEINFKKEMPISTMLFKQLTKFFENVNDIRAVEGRLFSHKLKIAGACDLIASYKDTPSIIDFKTSTKSKEKDYIYGYFIQCTTYAMMLYEMTGLLCKQIVIVITIEEENEAQIFVEKTENYMKAVLEMCRKYHER